MVSHCIGYNKVLNANNDITRGQSDLAKAALNDAAHSARAAELTA